MTTQVFFSHPEDRQASKFRCKYIEVFGTQNGRTIKHHFHRKLQKRETCQRCQALIPWYQDEPCWYKNCSNKLCWKCYEKHKAICSNHKETP